MKKKDLLEFRKKSVAENRKKLAVAINKIAELRVEFKAGKEKGPKKRGYAAGSQKKKPLL